MFLKLRVFFTILSAVCIAAVIPFGAFFGWLWAGMTALFAFLFFVLMLLCKQSQEFGENKRFDDSFINESQNSTETAQKEDKKHQP